MGKSVPVASVAFIAAALAGCGRSSATNVTAKYPTIASVCASHPQDIGRIGAGLTVYQLFTESENPQLITSRAASVVAATVTSFEEAAVGAHSSYPPAMRAFLRDLNELSSSLTSPVEHPSKIVGQETLARWQADAKRVGCKL